MHDPTICDGLGELASELRFQMKMLVKFATDRCRREDLHISHIRPKFISFLARTKEDSAINRIVSLGHRFYTG